jgi:ubiquinol-cytochrome c reductase cytochrome b subunit
MEIMIRLFFLVIIGERIVLIFFFFFFFVFVFFFPFVLGDPEMFIEADPMISPVHIVPE